MIPIPEEVGAILTKLRTAGYEAQPVGGCVRDSLLGLTPGDWDVCTSALPEEVVALFGEEDTIPTGMKHGTVTVRSGGRLSEVTTYRTDGAYTDHRRPDSVRFVSSLAEDLGRRDFTVNAMALDEGGRVVDLFGGQTDLEEKRIRCVGAPERRFREDALRILRALRFAARLDFSIEAETGKAMLACRTLLGSVSPERVLTELRGFLSAPKPGGLAETFAPVLAEVLPGLSETSVREAAPKLDASPADFALRMALLCRAMEAAEAEALAEALRFDSRTKRRFLGFGEALKMPLPRSRGELLPPVRLLGWEDAALLAALPGGEDFAGLLAEAKAEGLPLRAGELALGGTELLADGAKPGPEIGEMLEALLAAVWEGRADNAALKLWQERYGYTQFAEDFHGNLMCRDGYGDPDDLPPERLGLSQGPPPGGRDGGGLRSPGGKGGDRHFHPPGQRFPAGDNFGAAGGQAEGDLPPGALCGRGAPPPARGDAGGGLVPGGGGGGDGLLPRRPGHLSGGAGIL